MTKKRQRFVPGEVLSGKVVQIYAAVCNTELNEGRGVDVDHTYHATREDALIGAHKIDVMGSDGKAEPRLALALKNGEYIILPSEPVTLNDAGGSAHERLRRQALQKLTPAEKAVLGLS